MKLIKYWISIILSLIPFLLPAGCGLWVLLSLDRGVGITEWAILAASILFSVLIYKPVSKLRQESRFEAEHDEFGRSKKKGDYTKLSKKERDMIDLQKTAQMESILDSSALKKLTSEGPKDPKRELDALIGLNPIKDRIAEMVARFEFERGGKKKTSKAANTGYHAVFFGSPGTGKTTVARIMTGVLYKYGYIKRNKCVEVDGNYLKAGADTAAKTTLIIRQAYGGVLFIDEAYSLSYDSYGKQAIATIIKEMEDSRDRFVLILAGYTNEMKQLLSENPGFSSRIKEYLSFPDYSPDELWQIFSSMANQKGFVPSADAMNPFYVRMEKEKRLADFGNARTVRNVLDEAIDLHALNYQRGIVRSEDRYFIKGIDIRTTTTKTI